ncbi:unnamed protein product, partial [Laminaria digitata]
NRVVDAEDRNRLAARKAATTAASAELEMARLRTKLDKAGQSVVAETERLQEEAAEAKRELSAVELVSAGLRRERDQARDRAETVAATLAIAHRECNSAQRAQREAEEKGLTAEDQAQREG